MSGYVPTAAQTVGPFYSIGFAWQTSPPAAPDLPAVGGTVYDGQGAPVRDAVLELWAPGAHDEVIFRRVATDEQGHFDWPLPAPAARPAGWTVWVFARGLLQPLLTRVYVEPPPDHADPFWQAVPPDRRATLVAQRQPGPVERYRWDLRLQSAPDGSPETVFFDCHHPRELKG